MAEGPPINEGDAAITGGGLEEDEFLGNEITCVMSNQV